MRDERWTLRLGLLIGVVVGVLASTSIVSAAPDEPGDDDVGDVALNTPIGSLPGIAPNVNITCAGEYFAFPTQGCTLFSPFFQAPSGSGFLTTANLTAGPVTGPMRIVVLRAFRSQAGFPD